MCKHFLLLVTVLSLNAKTWAQAGKWDEQMQLKSCFIDIKADMFTATTFIEMEFYNPSNREIEGLQRFELKPGQVIVAFQLDLHGKYRDGSIEEKWKASNAYTTIVGKRIDPALLTMDAPNQYSLRIYPVPARGSRKVTMTIQQMLIREKNSLLYHLPLNFKDIVPKFKLNIAVNGSGMPVAKNLIAGQSFTNKEQHYRLNWNVENITLKNPVVFTMALPVNNFYCTKIAGQKTHFALYFHPSYEKDYEISPKQLAVYWDVSASLAKRDVTKEINFLKQFIAYHRVRKLTIATFNHKLLETAVFEAGDDFNTRWQDFLQKQEYNGATQIGCIDMSGIAADMHLLFTDGNNTLGSAKPKTGSALVYAVHTSNNADLNTLYAITGASGGKVIDLNKTSFNGAITAGSKAENWLLNITSASGKIITEQLFPAKVEGPIMINGTMQTWNDTLVFHYGNNNRVFKTEKVVLEAEQQCSSSAIDRVTMLNNFDWIIRSYSWENTLEFGLQEKIVTPNTAYIVLERVEDYVKYNIAPPKELEKECEKMNFVKKDNRVMMNQLKRSDEFQSLNYVVSIYNHRVKTGEAKSDLIELKREDLIREKQPLVTSRDMASNQDRSFKNLDNFGASRSMDFDNSFAFGDVANSPGARSKKNMSGLAMGFIGEADLRSTPSTTIEQALVGQVAGLNISNTGRRRGDMISFKEIQSQRNSLGPLYVLDGVPVSGNINNHIKKNEVNEVSFLDDVSALAIYGSRGMYGAVLITSKKGNAYYRDTRLLYRLNDKKDVDYVSEMLEIKKTAYIEKKTVYLRLKQQHAENPSFYFDMAQHFFESGLKEDAMDILLNAAEAANGSNEVLRAMAYVLESWKQFDEAINIYQQLLDDYPDYLHTHRDLGWAYYQKGNYQKAVDIFYGAITYNRQYQSWWNVSLKALMLYELNAVISIHKEKLDLSAIPPALIKTVNADLRIVLECNKGGLGGVTIHEPGGDACSFAKPVTKNGGVLNSETYVSVYNNGPLEYRVKNAQAGKYRVSLNYYDYQSYPGKIPAMIRMVVFRNFGKPNQDIKVENVIMDKQTGEVEINEIEWR